jgi:predicted RNA-binding Zn-ribbon protein involved in translation (DUF1610 family)
MSDETQPAQRARYIQTRPAKEVVFECPECGYLQEITMETWTATADTECLQCGVPLTVVDKQQRPG